LFGDHCSVIKHRKSNEHSCDLRAPLLTTSLGAGGGKLGRPGSWKNLSGLRLSVQYQKPEPDSQSCSASSSCSLAEKIKISPPNSYSAERLCTGAVGEHPGLQHCCWEGSLPASCSLQNGIYWPVSGCGARQQLV